MNLVLEEGAGNSCRSSQRGICQDLSIGNHGPASEGSVGGRFLEPGGSWGGDMADRMGPQGRPLHTAVLDAITGCHPEIHQRRLACSTSRSIFCHCNLLLDNGSVVYFGQFSVSLMGKFVLLTLFFSLSLFLRGSSALSFLKVLFAFAVVFILFLRYS